jgi:aspartyl-tRNA(Asn)/glutamyl-tRNA(Gln) amidotransferase subunit A
MGSSNENSVNGQVRNPWDRERVPGGSSGGSAAAVSAGFAPIALGSDTGGSIRQPAAFCGVTGLKPTYGSVSRYGLFAYGSSLDQIGPLGHSVDDVAEVFEVIRGKDPRDMTSVEAKPLGDWSQGVKGMKIGVPVEFFDCDRGLRPEVKSLLMENLKALEEKGAELVDVHLPILDHVIPVYYLIANCEASSNLSRYDGVRFGRRAENLDNLTDCFEKSRQEGFGQEVQTRVMLGTYALSAGYYDAFYKKANAIRSDMREQLADLFKNVDVLVGPTTPDVAFRLGEKVDDPLSMYMQDLYTTFVNLVGGPALSLPCGCVDELPVGLQIVGRDFDEASIFRVGKSIESTRKFEGLS